MTRHLLIGADAVRSHRARGDADLLAVRAGRAELVSVAYVGKPRQRELAVVLTSIRRRLAP